MIEFAIGLIPVMVLIMGLLQIVTLGRARMSTIREARHQAGLLSTLGTATLDSPQYIRDWQTGSDERHMTVDDTFTTADPSAFVRDVVDHSVVNASDWNIIGQAPGTPLRTLHVSGDVISQFGLVEGTAEDSVDVLPAVGLLFDRQDTINVKSTAWLGWTGGLK